MPSITFNVEHSKEIQTAVQLIDKRIDELSNEHKGNLGEFNKTWNGPVLDIKGSAMGLNITGQMVVQSGTVSVDLSVPMIAMSFKSKIIEVVEKEILSVLA
jgi:hypothetical protein